MSATDLLHDSIRSGDLDGVRAAISDGADVHSPMEADAAAYSGITPLIWAAREHGGEFVRLLLEAGADPTAQTSIYEHNALHFACQRADLESATRLLDAGCDPSQPSDDDGWTALTMACFANSTPVVELLLERGADVRAIDHNGENALSHAARSDAPALVSVLLAAGADPFLTREIEPWGPVHAAVYEGRIENLRAFLDWGIDPNYTVEAECLLAACTEPQRNGVEMTRLLIERGADPNKPPPSGFHSILGEAASSGRDDIVEELLQSGADPTLRDYAGETALDIARNRLRSPLMPPPMADLRARAEAAIKAIEADPNCEDRGEELEETRRVLELMGRPEPASENFERIISLLESAMAG